MCRNIKTLYNFAPPATDQEIHDAARQFVRKISGFKEPSAVNKKAFIKAIDDIAQSMHLLLHSLTTSAPARNREQEAVRARVRALKRFGKTH